MAESEYYRYKKQLYYQKTKHIYEVTVITRKAPASSPSTTAVTAAAATTTTTTNLPCGRHEVKDEAEYKMDHAYRGKVFIINNHFKPEDTESYRKGTEIDEENLKQVFTTQLDFKAADITVFADCTCKQMLDVVDQAAKEDYTDYDCVIVAVMTHGQEDLLMGEDKNYVTVDDISEPFQFSNTLLYKPKIFIFQACRGDQMMKSYEGTLKTDASSAMPDMSRNRVPAYPDFLYMFSAPGSFYSVRNGKHGSWFIQSLCNAIKNEADIEKTEIMEILTKANKGLSEKTNEHEFYQVASFESTLLKELYFKTKKDVVPMYETGS